MPSTAPTASVRWAFCMLVFGASLALRADDFNTTAKFSAATVAARTLFSTTCSRCHNSDGTGNPALGIPDFTNTSWQGSQSDAQLLATIVNGVPGKMPPFGFLPKDQIQALVHEIVRKFAPRGEVLHGRPGAPKPPPPPIGATLPPPGHGAGPVVFGTVGVYTQHNDNARDGANLHETTLTPANVNPRQFGLLFRQVVDDQIFTQPLYVPGAMVHGERHNVVIVATTSATVYAFDADRQQPALWTRTLGPAASIHQYRFWCQDILDTMSIIGTPVVDPKTLTLYVVALTHEGNGFVQRLHALDVTTGAERPGSPVVIATDGFNPILQNPRPALLLSRGHVFFGYSSHCDVDPYHGFLFEYDAATLKQLAVFNASPDGSGDSIWQSGQGPAADSRGNIYFVTSNGTWDGVRNFSESFIRLTPDDRLADWYTVGNYADLDQRDMDLNSSGPMLIPGTHEIMGAGKQGVIYLLDTRHLGHLAHPGAEIQYFQVSFHEINSGAVYWKSRSRGGWIYVWPQDDCLRAYPFNHGRFTTTPETSRETSAYPGAMLSLSANGGRDGILWANACLAPHGDAHINGGAVLRAYDANDIHRELYDSNVNPARDACGRISKNAPPTVVNGKVYLSTFGTLPSRTGALYVYGLLPAAGQ